MANLTKPQQHNRNLDKVFDNYKKLQNNLPTIYLYSRFLEIAEEKLSISKDEARSKYGLYTMKEWETLLNLGWNSKN